MAKGEYKNTMQKLGEMLKTEPAKTPIQEVRPIVEQTKADEPSKEQTKQAHVNFWVEDQLLQRLKLLALKNRTTIREIGTQALEEYLKRNE